MSSTFGGLSTAYSGLSAARAGLEVAGQNIANVNTEGYTRQRVATSAVGPLDEVRGSTGQARIGQGVRVDGVDRLGDAYLDTRVRTTAATGGYTAVRANALVGLETILAEPGENGLSTRFQAFFASWQDLSNQPGEPAPAGALLEEAGVLVKQIADGYRDVEGLWAQNRDQLTSQVGELNNAAVQVAKLNEQIRYALSTRSNANELIDQRSMLTTTIAALSGGTVQERTDGTVDVLVGGNVLVAGDKANAVHLTGAGALADGTPVVLEWSNRPGTAVDLRGGEIAGSLTLLAPAGADGSGGPIARAAQAYNAVATTLAATVNAVHSTGQSYTGETGLNFFALDPTRPAALGLAVVPTTAEQIATGRPGAGNLDGSVADAISKLSTDPAGPARQWADFAVSVAVESSTTMQHALLADTAAVAATTAQLSNASVDLDEESVNLMSYQRAYQGNARVMTAIDEMLDQLINRTGRVGL